MKLWQILTWYVSDGVLSFPVMSKAGFWQLWPMVVSPYSIGPVTVSGTWPIITFWTWANHTTPLGVWFKCTTRSGVDTETKYTSSIQGNLHANNVESKLLIWISQFHSIRFPSFLEQWVSNGPLTLTPEKKVKFVRWPGSVMGCGFRSG